MKKNILKKKVLNIIIVLISFILFIMLFNFNTYDLIIDIILLINNIILYFIIKDSLYYYTKNN